ncbi:MAG: tryptophan--tRNA ligase [Spirochaetia bacterium]|nr:tryptophan--tRNA ligase [Spirochaetia bacterium]
MKTEKEILNKKNILSGMQPTGRLHLGHYLGVLTNYAKLQNEYNCYFMAADLHAMTAFYSDYEKAQEFLIPMISDWLAAGIDPEKAVIFVQSDVSEHSELALILSMYTPVSWLMRNPTYKDKQINIDKEIDSHGFLGYPVLQAADILLYDAEFVPIGEDQLPHLDLSRDIVNRFNHFNKHNQNNVFRLPKPLLSSFPKVLGTDGRKMSKSYNNTLILSSDEDSLMKEIMTMKTDTARVRLKDPGNPQNCPVFTYYDFFAKERKDEIADNCMKGSIGCKDCKNIVGSKIVVDLEPFRERYKEAKDNSQNINEILKEGAIKAKEKARETMQKVKDSMGFYLK